MNRAANWSYWEQWLLWANMIVHSQQQWLRTQRIKGLNNRNIIWKQVNISVFKEIWRATRDKWNSWTGCGNPISARNKFSLKHWIADPVYWTTKDFPSLSSDLGEEDQRCPIVRALQEPSCPKVSDFFRAGVLSPVVHSQGGELACLKTSLTKREPIASRCHSDHDVWKWFAWKCLFCR